MTEIKATTLLKDGMLSSSYDFIFLTYLQAYLKPKGFTLSYSKIKSSFTFNDLRKSIYFPILMYANELDCYKTLPSSLKFFPKTFEEELGVVFQDYELPFHIFNPFTNLDVIFPFTHIATDLSLQDKFAETHVFEFLNNMKGQIDFVNVSNFETVCLSSICQAISTFITKGAINQLHYYVVPYTKLISAQPALMLSYLVLEIPFISEFVNLAFDKPPFTYNVYSFAVWESVAKDLGYLRHYTAKEKYSYTKKEYQVGDVVLLYERSLPTSKSASKTILNSCVISVIREITQESVTFEHIFARHTKLHNEILFNQLTLDEQELYNFDPSSTVNCLTKTYDWSKLGVDYCLGSDEFFEPYFFNGLGDNDVYDELRILDNKLVSVGVGFYDIVKTILDDYGISYSKRRFNILYNKGV